MKRRINSAFFLLFLPLGLMAAIGGCSSSSSTQPTGKTQYINLGNNFGADTFMYSLPVPSLDSAFLGTSGTDTWVGIGFRGITHAGSYQFGLHDGVSVEFENGCDVDQVYAQPGGAFVLTSFVNYTAHPSFEGNFSMTIIDTIYWFGDTIPKITEIDTLYETGSFSVHKACQ